MALKPGSLAEVNAAARRGIQFRPVDPLPKLAPVVKTGSPFGTFSPAPKSEAVKTRLFLEEKERQRKKALNQGMGRYGGEKKASKGK